MEIRVQYKDVTQGIFTNIARNELVMRIQPSEAIYMKMNTKTPGLITRAIPTELDLTYKRRFSDAKIPEAYEALILDAFKGDHSNFVRDDELDVAWKVSMNGPPAALHAQLTMLSTGIPIRSSPLSSTGLMARTASNQSPSNTRTVLVAPNRQTTSQQVTDSSAAMRDSE